MGKTLTEKQKAANKIKLDEAKGVNPDPADVLASEGKEPKPSGLLTREIDMLIARRAAIATNQTRAADSMRSHQARLDRLRANLLS